MTHDELVRHAAPFFQSLEPGQVMICIVYQPGRGDEEIMCTSNLKQDHDIRAFLMMFLDEAEHTETHVVKSLKDS